MRDIKRLAFFVGMVCLLSSPLGARTRKGEKLLEQGRAAEARKQWETALDFYEQALQEDPGDSAYQLSARKVRFQAAMARIDAGQKLRSEGKLEEALKEFQRGFAIDPSSSIAEQEIRRTKEMIEREKVPATKSATPEERGMTPAEKAQRDAEEKSSRMLPLPELKPFQRQISTLKMNNQPVRVLYETVGKLAGINVILDPEFQNPPGKTNFTVDLSNTSLEQALDYLAIQTKSYWKPLSPNTIFVTNDNVQKRRDYEDYVVKVFYVRNATTVQELQEISTTIRSVTEIRRAFTYNAQNAILVRGTADQVALAEKLIQDLDKPKAEVVVDVIVMEASRQRIRDLAATFTTGSGAPGINVPAFYNRALGTSTTSTTPGSSTSTTTSNPATNAVPLNKLATLGFSDFSITAPGALFQALLSDTYTRVLQQPQVRAVENFKASLKIGDRIPYASGSFQPGVGTVGLNPLVSTQFNFLDTGVNVDITPKVHNGQEVSLHVELDLSTKSGEVNLGGLSQPIVSRRTIVHDIRLREGEVNVLGGLTQMQETRVRAGVPGLMDIPGLGRLFSTEHIERPRSDLLIVLIPHVVRSPDFSETNLRAVLAGNDQNVKLTYSPRTDTAAPVTPAPGTAPVAAPAPLPAPGTGGAVPAPGPPAPNTAATPAAAAPAPVPATAPRLSFNVPAVSTPLSAAFTVELRADNVTELFSAPMRLKYDPKVLRAERIEAGPLLSVDGKGVTFNQNTVAANGEATVTLTRLPGSGGITGSGTLLRVTFQAVGKGSSAVTVIDPSLKNVQQQPVSVVTAPVTVTVQ